jgi:ankyrin repeat protein
MKPSRALRCRAVLACAALLLAVPILLSARASQTKPPERPQVFDMGTYKVSAPPGGGWDVKVEQEAARVVFSRHKGGGLLGGLSPAPQNRATYVVASAVVLPTSKWRMAENEARDVIIDEYVVVMASGQDSSELQEKGDTELNGKKLRFAKFHGEFAGGMATADQLVYLYFPSDFRKTHRYFKFESIFLRQSSGVKLYENPGSERVFEVIDSLEIADPLQSYAGPDGELIRAAAAGDAAAARQALDRGAKPDASVPSTTALATAAFHGRQEIVDLLLELGAGIDKADGETGGTPLYWAVMGMEPVIAAYLVERGADVNKRSKDGSSALMMAAFTVQADLVSTLIERGAEVNSKNEIGMTPLMFASSSGSKECVELLIAHGADVNAQRDDGWTVLIHAIAAGNVDIAKLLMEKGADVGLKNDEGMTALWPAVDNGSTGIVRALIEKGADVEALLGGKKGEDFPSPLHLALYRAKPDIAKMLIEAGADVNAKNKSGLTPLMRAALSEQVEIVRLLIARGADVNAREDGGKTALKYAKKANNKEIAKMLVAAGAK